MAEERPEYVKCVGNPHAAPRGPMWCGRAAPWDWHFADAAHAAENGRMQGRHVACPACVEAIITSLRHGHEAP